MAKEKFNFMWKLTENYFNALMVLVGVVLMYYALSTNDSRIVILAGVWGLTFPFVATFIDKKSNKV